MILVLSVLLAYTFILKIFPPKKPSDYFGYQLGNSKKSEPHWQLANQYATNYQLGLYSLLITGSFLADYFGYDADLLLLILYIGALIMLYFLVERKLKQLDV